MRDLFEMCVSVTGRKSAQRRALWSSRDGSSQNAKEAAGKIHSDIEEGFIAAEVMTYNDLIELGSEGAVKNAGKYMQKGKTYTVQDGDICYYKFNPPKKDAKKK